MSSPSSYTLVNRINHEDPSQIKRTSMSHFSTTPSHVPATASLYSQGPHVHFTDELVVSDLSSALPTNREILLFVYLDLQSQLSSQQIMALRAINDSVRIYTDESICYGFLHNCTERVFFICHTDENELVGNVHDISSIEAIFLISSNNTIDRNRLPKLDGIYQSFEELLVGLKTALEWFEEAQMNLFAFERDQIFLWSQLWREELLKPSQYHPPSTKEGLVAMAQGVYRENPKLLDSLHQFDQSYSRSDALQWCFYSPFPSRFLQQALRTRQLDLLDHCRFLIMDVSRILQSSKHKSGTKLFRGMKLTKETIDQLEEHFGQLICYKGYFTCTKSRKVALAMANAPNYRPDLIPVLFKITADKSSPVGEVSGKNDSTKIIFDFYVAFRVKYVVRDGLTTIKLECALADGKTMAKEYFSKHGIEHVSNLLSHRSVAPTAPPPPRRLPPLERISTASKTSDKSSREIADAPDEYSTSVIPKPENEERVLDLIRSGDIDEAIETFKRLKHVSANLLTNMGEVFVDKKGDYSSAIKCFTKALKLKEKNGEDPSVILNKLAMAHENQHEFDLALSYHTRALEIQQKNPNADKAAIVSSLLGLANTYCGQGNFSKAQKHAKDALSINESITPQNELNLAMNLTILASIVYRSGDTKKALKHSRRALSLLEQCVPSDSPNLTALLNNIATMQLAAGLFSEARASFDRALKICAKTLPEGHPKRITMENNLRQIMEMEKNQLEEISVDVDSQ